MVNNQELSMDARQQEIHWCVNRAGRISVEELSQQLNIPIELLNSDLKTLAERRKIVLTYNGAASLTVGMDDIYLALRAQRQSEEKGYIGEFDRDRFRGIG
jgi:DeoR/GlpR family transcriptional regulator of sugar metabolism